MATILQSKSIYYNDVNLIAKPAKLESRSQVPRELHRIVVSPMSAVVGQTFSKEATKLGLTVCQHKFCDIDNAVINYSVVPNKENLFVSIGLDDWERARELSNEGAKNWLIDCANGYLPQISEVIKKLLNRHVVNRLIVGNIMTQQGIWLYDQFITEVDELLIRIGIAGGAACSTSDSTGYNRGNITEIIECSQIADQRNIKIIADGGIKNGNYAAKAFGAGADYIMMGNYFSKAKEAYTWENGDGTYWGGASTKQQELYGGVRRHSEGKVLELDKSSVKPLKELVEDLWGGLSSSVSYSGHTTLSNFIGNGIFEIKQNSLPPNGR